jgi:hypothetical protein
MRSEFVVLVARGLALGAFRYPVHFHHVFWGFGTLLEIIPIQLLEDNDGLMILVFSSKSLGYIHL